MEVVYMRNPKWSEEEVILLVDRYYESVKQGQSLVNSAQKLQELSDLLRNHATDTMGRVPDTYRNLSGLKMKCANIKSLVEGGGLAHTSSLEQSVVEMMLTDPDGLHKKAERIRAEWAQGSYAPHK